MWGELTSIGSIQTGPVFFCYMGPQCVKQNFAEALVRNALMAGRAGLNGGVEMISDISDWKDFKSFDANGRTPVAWRSCVDLGSRFAVSARPFHERGPDWVWESLDDCSLPSRASEISEFVGDVLIWWLPATDEVNPLLLNDALIVAEMEDASNDQECGVLGVLQSLVPEPTSAFNVKATTTCLWKLLWAGGFQETQLPVSDVDVVMLFARRSSVMRT